MIGLLCLNTVSAFLDSFVNSARERREKEPTVTIPSVLSRCQLHRRRTDARMTRAGAGYREAQWRRGTEEAKKDERRRGKTDLDHHLVLSTLGRLAGVLLGGTAAPAVIEDLHKIDFRARRTGEEEEVGVQFEE